MTRRRVVPGGVESVYLMENFVLMRRNGSAWMKCVNAPAPGTIPAGQRKAVATMPAGWRPPFQMVCLVLYERKLLGIAYFNRTGEVEIEAWADLPKGGAFTLGSIGWPVQ